MTIDREILRPAFESLPRYRMAEFDRALPGDTRMPVGDYLDHTLAHEFAGFCAAMDLITSDAAVAAGGEAFVRMTESHLGYTDTMVSRACILAAIAAPSTGDGA